MKVAGNGKEAVAIRSIPGSISDVPIIALTAFAIKGDVEHFGDAERNGYVTKPVDWNELSSVIRKLIQ